MWSLDALACDSHLWPSASFPLLVGSQLWKFQMEITWPWDTAIVVNVSRLPSAWIEITPMQGHHNNSNFEDRLWVFSFSTVINFEWSWHKWSLSEDYLLRWGCLPFLLHYICWFRILTILFWPVGRHLPQTHPCPCLIWAELVKLDEWDFLASLRKESLASPIFFPFTTRRWRQTRTGCSEQIFPVSMCSTPPSHMQALLEKADKKENSMEWRWNNNEVLSWDPIFALDDSED